MAKRELGWNRGTIRKSLHEHDLETASSRDRTSVDHVSDRSQIDQGGDGCGRKPPSAAATAGKMVRGHRLLLTCSTLRVNNLSPLVASHKKLLFSRYVVSCSSQTLTRDHRVLWQQSKVSRQRIHLNGGSWSDSQAGDGSCWQDRFSSIPHQVGRKMGSLRGVKELK